MSENITQDLTGGDGRTFEERVMARFDAMDARFNAIDVRFNEIDARFNEMEERFNKRFNEIDSNFRDVNARLEKLELHSYDTKPIWERAIKDIADTRRELFKRLDRIDSVVHENRADIRDAEDRIEKLEQKSTQ
jgi:hypothetical protein